MRNNALGQKGIDDDDDNNKVVVARMMIQMVNANQVLIRINGKSR